jgi:hypothetical protein
MLLDFDNREPQVQWGYLKDAQRSLLDTRDQLACLLRFLQVAQLFTVYTNKLTIFPNRIQEPLKRAQDKVLIMQFLKVTASPRVTS